MAGANGAGQQTRSRWWHDRKTLVDATNAPASGRWARLKVEDSIRRQA